MKNNKMKASIELAATLNLHNLRPEKNGSPTILLDRNGATVVWSENLDCWLPLEL